jgi:RNA polymerase sigma-70 factor, ECF subfamily
VTIPRDEQVDERRALESSAGFEQFFRANYPTLFGSLSAAADDVEDALQDAFVQPLLNLSIVSRYDNPASWVRMVAIRRLLNRERWRSRSAGAVVRLSSTAETEMHGAAAMPDLANRVRRLPLRQRVAVALFYFWDLPVREIATAMGISQGAVTASLVAARRGQSVGGAARNTARTEVEELRSIHQESPFPNPHIAPAGRCPPDHP